MTFIFEISGPFQAKPGLHRDNSGNRVWWLWFAVAVSRKTYYELITSGYYWEGGEG